MGDLRRAHLPSAGARASREHHRTARPGDARVRGARRRGRMAGRADPTARSSGVGRPARRAPRDPGLRHGLRLGQCRPIDVGLAGRCPDRHAGLLPAGLPPGRRDAATSRSRAGGSRRQPRPEPGPGVSARGPAAAAAPDPGRIAPRRAAPARRVRRLRDRALRNLHDRHHPAVPLHLQRSGGGVAGRGPGGLLPGAPPGRERGSRWQPVRTDRVGRPPAAASRTAWGAWPCRP